jgi:gliding motility-associated-like protein
MKLKLCLLFLLFETIFALTARSQDFSNKGTDFWVGYGLHCKMFSNNSGGSQNMVLYIATEAATDVTVSIPGSGYSSTYQIAANTIFTTSALPKTGLQDARLTQEGISSKGIHITSTKPVVAYAHIFDGSVSGATLLFPTQTLGKEYYSINFEQHSNEGNSNCFFYAMAVDTGTTTIEVTPSANTLTMTAGTTYTYSLTQGQVFNALGTINSSGTTYNGTDLTGSKIRSISSGAAGCKRIAVFSGSGKLNITCPLGPNNATADNYMVQAFPKDAWGKNYLTVPTSQMEANYFRIAVSDPSTVVRLNGTVLTGLVNNFYYQVGQTKAPNLIEADKPIMVAQYITSANQCGNTAIGGDGDPEVIYLSPVEQNIDKVIINSTPNYAITRHYVNVVIPNGGTALSSFRIDGVAPSSSFVVHPQNAAYSYLVQKLTAGQHIIQSDSSFNAIAYGYGPAESYGYNAGANVKDLYQFISIKNQYASVDYPATCKNSPFYFSITFPYQPLQIKWQFNGLFTDVTTDNPVADSSWLVNGKRLYKYSLPGSYSTTQMGTFPIKVVAQNPTSDGCSGQQEIGYDLQVYDKPTSNFSFSGSGCQPDSIHFVDNSNANGRSAAMWLWDFSDGSTSSVKSPAHLFASSKTFNVKHSMITDIGCLSDTVTKAVAINALPVPNFTVSVPGCVEQDLRFTDASTSASGAITSWAWDLADGTSFTNASNTGFTHKYTTAGTYKVSLKTVTDKGCTDSTSKQIRITPTPSVGFIVPDNCVNDPYVQFKDTSSISDGSQSQFSYLWNFGDPNASLANPNTSALQNPKHKYIATGNYNVALTVTSSGGCISNITQPFTINGALPQSIFSISGGSQQCSNSQVSIINSSTVDFGNIVKMEIYWDYSNDPTNKTTIIRPVSGAAYSHTYPEFFSPSTKAYNITVVAYSGDNCLNTSSQTLTLKATPQLVFTALTNICANEPAFQLTEAKLLNGLPGTGVYSGRGINASGIFDPATAGAGIHTIRYTFTGTNGCVNYLEQPITVYPVPAVDAGPDKFVLEGGNAVLAGSGTGNGLSYLWSPSVGLNNPTVAQPTVTPTDDITYTLTVTSADKCVSSDEVFVKVLKAPTIPNTFSPNGDGIHDRWEIKYLNTYPGCTVQIYNRYGQLLFQSNGYSTPWDGTYKDRPLPAGTYYYIINPKNGRKQMTGFVDIIR